MKRFTFNAALMIIGFYALFIGLALIMLVLGQVTSEVVMEWAVKAGLVALVLFVLSVVMSAIVAVASKKR
jgi:hypothetical protein